MTNRRELADRLEDNADWLRDFPTRSIIDNKLSGVDGRGIDSVEVLLREAARLLREPVAGEVEELARAIDPGTFKRWQQQYDYCIREGDPERFAQSCADAAEGDGVAQAKEAAERVQAILRARLDDEGKG